MGTFPSLDDLPCKISISADFEHGNFPVFGSMLRSYMKYNTVIYGFYRAKKGIDFGKSLFVLEGILFNLVLTQVAEIPVVCLTLLKILLIK